MYHLSARAPEAEVRIALLDRCRVEFDLYKYDLLDESVRTRAI